MMSNPVSFAFLIRHPVYLTAFGFGAGLSPKAPGTAGTIFAVALYCLLQPMDFRVYLFITMLFIIAGVWICHKTTVFLKVHDHPGIVWDEVAGYFITMLGAPFEVIPIVLGFILFRLFDIFKPWPVAWLDRNMQGGVGIMVDDIVAGLYALVVLQGVLFLFNS